MQNFIRTPIFFYAVSAVNFATTMKNIYIHTQQEDLEIARQQLTAV